MSVAAALAGAVATALGAVVTDAEPTGGGAINSTWRFGLADGRRAFVKTRAGAAAGEFETEAASLRWLASSGGVAVPEVLAVGAGDAGAPCFLALEWVPPGVLDTAGAEALGRGLAAMHTSGAPAFGAPAPGAPGPLRIGELVLGGAPGADWPAFYASARLAPVARAARDRGSLSAAGAKAVETVCARIGELAGPPEPPARLHGDLWGGNVLAGADGRARLIDPIAHGGHREVDLAMLRLFGAPSQRVFAAYEEASPPSEGHERRVELWQLFPLLVHALLFGGAYGEAAERIARGYAD